MLCSTTLRVAFSWHGLGKFTLRASEGKFGRLSQSLKMGGFSGILEGLRGKWAERIYCKLKSGEPDAHSGRQSRPLFKPLDDFMQIVLGECENIFLQFEYTFYAFRA